MYESGRERCQHHPDQFLESICLTRGCDERVLCPDCHLGHNPHHEFTPYSIKLDLQSLSRAFGQQLQCRLSQLFSHLESCLLGLVASTRESLSQQVGDLCDNAFLRYCNNDHMLVHTIRQFVRDDFSLVDSAVFQKIMEVLRRAEESQPALQPQHLGDYEQAMVRELVNAMARVMGVLEKVYWEGSLLGAGGTAKTSNYPAEFQAMMDQIQAEESALCRVIDSPKSKGVVTLNKLNLGGLSSLSKVLEKLRETPTTVFSAGTCADSQRNAGSWT